MSGRDFFAIVSSLLRYGLLTCVFLPTFLSCKARPDLSGRLAQTGPTTDQYSFHSSLSFEDLKTFVSQTNPTDSVDFLRQLNKKDPGFLEHLVLIFKSQSTQSASYLNPRLVIAGSKNLILALTLAGGAGSKKIELIDSSDPYNIKFKEISLRGSKDKTAAVNEKPVVCSSCHGIEPRTIWDSYPLWPGTYGGEDLFIHKGTVEYTQFKALLSNWDKEMLDLESKLMSVKDPYAKVDLESEESFGISGHNEVNQRLADLNWFRILRKLKALSLEDKNKYLIGKFLKLPPDDHYEDDPARSDALRPSNVWGSKFALLDTSYHNYIKDIKFDAQRAWIEKNSRRTGSIDLSMDKSYPQTSEVISPSQVFRIALLRVMMELLGESIANWSTVFSRENYSFQTPNQAIYDLNATIDQLNMGDQFISAASSYSPSDYAPLRNQSHPAEDLSQLDSLAVLVRCKTCHTDPYRYGALTRDFNHLTQKGTFYPFDDIEAMKALSQNSNMIQVLKQSVLTKDKKLRMPPAPMSKLNPEELEAFLAYLALIEGER